MAKKVASFIKLQVRAGQANPASVGPTLGQHGVNIMEFAKAFNDKTQSQAGDIIPVEITVYEDRSFTFITKTPPAAQLLLKAAGLQSGSGEPHMKKVGTVCETDTASWLALWTAVGSSEKSTGVTVVPGLECT